MIIVTTQIQRDSESNSTAADLYVTKAFRTALGDGQSGSTRWIPIDVNLIRNFALNRPDDNFSAISFSIQLIPISGDSFARKIAIAVASASNGLTANPAAGTALAAFHRLTSELLEEAKLESGADKWGDMPPQFTLNFAGTTCAAGSAWTGIEVQVDRKHQDQESKGIVDIDALSEYCFYAADETTTEVQFSKQSAGSPDCADNPPRSTLLNSHVGIRVTVEPTATTAFQKTDAKTFDIKRVGTKSAAVELWGVPSSQSDVLEAVKSKTIEIPGMQSARWRSITSKSALTDVSIGKVGKNPWGSNLVPLVNTYVDNWAFRYEWSGDYTNLKDVKIKTLAFVADPTMLSLYSLPKAWKTGTDASGNFIVTMPGTESVAYDLAKSFVECQDWVREPEACVLGR